MKEATYEIEESSVSPTDNGRSSQSWLPESPWHDRIADGVMNVEELFAGVTLRNYSNILELQYFYNIEKE